MTKHELRLENQELRNLLSDVQAMILDGLESLGIEPDESTDEDEEEEDLEEEH